MATASVRPALLMRTRQSLAVISPSTASSSHVLGMADIVDRNIVVLAPEERNGVESFMSPEHVEGRGLSLAFREDPMLDANSLAGVRVRPARYVAGREDPRRARFEIGVHDDAAINLEAGCFGELEARADAHPRHNEIGLDDASACEPYSFALKAAGRFPQMEDDAVLLVKRLHKAAQVGTQNSLHRPFFGRDNVNFNVPRAQRRRDFESDEARAQHDRSARRLRPFDDCSGVAKRAKHKHVGGGRARNGCAYGLGPRGQEKPIEANLVAVGKRDLARANVDPGDGRIETKVDGVLGIEAAVAQGDPLLGRAAGEIVL